ncbi:hypothetical protein [Actinacidiphila bryophytorum]|uniref:hypothetical protein n=1 Tax=Actinacidiphila bryophytorum TaxID=1436133 RepID=UPI002AFE9BE8|nr:hypothetical protein [Actinacidiphila bryophytorum]
MAVSAAAAAVVTARVARGRVRAAGTAAQETTMIQAGHRVRGGADSEVLICAPKSAQTHTATAVATPAARVWRSAYRSRLLVMGLSVRGRTDVHGRR